MIEPAPDSLKGRVALASGARIYSRPTYASASWSLKLPDPPLGSGDELARVKVFRVVGVVRGTDGSLGGAGDFVAVTNDLDGEAGRDGGPVNEGCGPRFDDLAHLRMLLYVPIIHLAPVTTRVLELEPLTRGAAAEQVKLGAGVRIGEHYGLAGLPLAEGATWRSIDADGIRLIAPIPDDAVGVAWDADEVPSFADAGEALFRDAEGSTLWLRDDAGATVELTVRNACAEHSQVIEDPAEVESLRALALDAFYDQRVRSEPAPVVEDAADYLIPAGTPLRWPDGELAGETLADWSVAIGVGQTWDGRRCFTLELGAELETVAAPALACVDPKALELLADSEGFEVSDEVALGGSIELGPPRSLAGGPWNEQALRITLNGRHDSVAECLRPLVVGSAGLAGARWDLRLTVSDDGRVEEVEVEARGRSLDAVDDCLRAEAYTWLMPTGAVGQLEVPVTLGSWTEADEPEPEPEPKAKPKSKAKPKPDPERGKIIIIRDDEPDEPAPDEPGPEPDGPEPDEPEPDEPLPDEPEE